MDVLTDVLERLRVSGRLYARVEFRAPWGVKLPAGEKMIFHVVDRGGAVLCCEGQPPLTLGAGDIVVVSGGGAHILADSLETIPVGVDEFLTMGRCSEKTEGAACPMLVYGGFGASSTVSCGHFVFDGGRTHPLFSLLPPLIHISSEEKDTTPWLDNTLRFMSYEICQRQEGADTALARLIDLLFIQIIRSWLSKQPEGGAGWLGALRDTSIGEAIRLIHERPQEAWTVESLGRAIGMSRSGFSARFQLLVGEPPLKYLTQWRMHLAADVLTKEPDLGLEQIAQRVGYDSLVSFSRAFKRHYQLSPGAWRRQHLEVEVQAER